MVNSDMKNLRRLGILVPVFSLREENDLGVGDTRAMRKMVDWAAEHRIGFLQLLPINETGGDNSPYNAISSVALDPLLIDLESIPQISREQIQKADDAFVCHEGDEDLVDYDQSNRLKWSLLADAFEKFWSAPERNSAFEAFCITESNWLTPYTKFRYLMGITGSEAWEAWPKEYNTAEKAEEYLASMPSDELAKQLAYYGWVQWHAFSQWRELRDYAGERNVKLMGDIPIGISYCSADVFFESQWFDLELSGGSPPETVFKDDAFACQWGQNWGIPLYRWDVLEKDDFSWWRRRIEKLTDVFHIFRIDHIIGFYRIFSFPWRPPRNEEFIGLSTEEAKKITGGALPGFQPRPDDTSENKAANLADGDKYIKMVLESAGDAEVVGEDLGCVPDYVRPHLEQMGVAGFKVCQWEIQDNGRVVPGSAYPECAFTTYATHDHDSIPAMWKTLTSVLGSAEKEWALRDLSILSEFGGLPFSETEKTFAAYGTVVKWALFDKLLKSNADYAALMVTDVIDSTRRINIPGTVGGENWRYRLPYKLADMPENVCQEWRKLSELVRVSNRG